MSEKKLLKKISNDGQHLKYFHILAAIYITGLIATLTVSARLFPLHVPMTNFTLLSTGGAWIIPLSFFIQDITTEVYGYSKSRQLVQMSALILIFYVIGMKFITYLPAPDVKNIDASYNVVFDALPRHLFALLLGIFISNLVNDCIISKLKNKFSGGYLPLRFIIATAIGSAVLQLIGTSIAWVGNLDFKTGVIPFVIFSYVYKVGFEAMMTPVNMFICNKLKKAEGIDVYDVNINYNPFICNRS